jgi:hypothetical protein
MYFISNLNGNVKRNAEINPKNHNDKNQSHCERFLRLDK